MSSEAVSVKDPSAVAFFVDNLCQEADLIYRFGYALTLSEEGAAKLVYQTYEGSIGRLTQFLHYSGREVRLELMKIAWHEFQSWRQSFKETDTLVLDFLHSLTVDIRIVLILVDALGFTKAEATAILELQADELCQYLARGRQAMIQYDEHGVLR